MTQGSGDEGREVVTKGSGDLGKLWLKGGDFGNYDQGW